MSYFVQHGADRGRLSRATWFSAAAGVVGAVIGDFIAASRGAGTAETALWSLGVGAGIGAGAFALTHGLAEGAGATILAFLQPSGTSCPPARQFSLQEALAAQGDVAGALASYEDLIRAAPADDAVLRMRAADLYARSKSDPARAAALYREAQRVASLSPSEHVYTTNRLITLYLGPLDDPGRAMAELRRLVDRYPGTDVARDAREALATLKRRTPDRA